MTTMATTTITAAEVQRDYRRDYSHSLVRVVQLLRFRHAVDPRGACPPTLDRRGVPRCAAGDASQGGGDRRAGPQRRRLEKGRGAPEGQGRRCRARYLARMGARLALLDGHDASLPRRLTRFTNQEERRWLQRRSSDSWSDARTPFRARSSRWSTRRERRMASLASSPSWAARLSWRSRTTRCSSTGSRTRCRTTELTSRARC